MNEQTNEQPSQSERLRSIIQTAVVSEMNTQVAPLKDRVLVIDARTTQLQRDFGAADTKIEELQDVVLGNNRLRLRGLQAEIQELNEKITKLLRERDTLVSEIQGARKVLYAIGALASIPMLQQLGIFNAIGKILTALNS